jgi:hypothetical protein
MIETTQKLIGHDEIIPVDAYKQHTCFRCGVLGIVFSNDQQR